MQHRHWYASQSQWHSANPVAQSQYYRVLWSLNKTVKLEQGCVSAEGSGIYMAGHICIVSDKIVVVFTNSAADSVIITKHALPCCYHHYTQTLPLWNWNVTALTSKPLSHQVETTEERYPRNFPWCKQSSNYISLRLNTVQTARGIFKHSSMQIRIRKWWKGTVY